MLLQRFLPFNYTQSIIFKRHGISPVIAIRERKWFLLWNALCVRDRKKNRKKKNFKIQTFPFLSIFRRHPGLTCVGYRDSSLTPCLAHAASSLSPGSSLKLQDIFISVFCSLRQDLSVWILFAFIWVCSRLGWRRWFFLEQMEGLCFSVVVSVWIPSPLHHSQPSAISWLEFLSHLGAGPECFYFIIFSYPSSTREFARINDLLEGHLSLVWSFWYWGFL